jgi:hypothetical protein
MKPVVLGGVSALSLSVLTACGLVGGGASVEERDDLFALVAPESVNEGGVGYGGTVEVVGDCVGLRLSEPDPVVVIWPHGTELVSTDPVVLDVPGTGRVEEGDEVAGGGSQYDSPAPMDGVEVPEGCQDFEVWSFTPSD